MVGPVGLVKIDIVRLQALEALLDRTDDLVSMRSSGSSGTPLNVFRSPLEHAIDTICTVHMFTNSGFRWHDKMLVFKTPHAVVKSDSMIQRFGVFYRKTISVHSEFEEARHLIETQKFNILMGYSAHIELLAEHLSQSGGSLPQFRSVFLGGEKITKTRREKVQRLLKPEFLMEYYGSTESGNIAHKLEHAYVVEPKTVYISRDEEIESMAPGAVSILLSSLFMFGQPLINYRIGDQIIDAQENDAGRIIQFESVLGRSNDQLIDKNNSRWSGIRFYAPIEGHPCVRRFVVQQFEAGALEIQIIPTPESNRADREDFEAMTNKLFAQDFKVSLEFVDDIPLAASGKFKVIQQHLST